jgi:1-acyl-sn-glycerol-3-phosphate acyltransferase
VTDAAARGTLGRLIYGPYTWLALLVCGTPALVLVTIAPGRLRRRRLARWFARLFFVVIGSPIKVEGETHMPAGACIVVANHASYLDGIVLTAALPPNFTFVIKHEMAVFPFAGFFLRRIGSEFIDRSNDGRRQSATRRLFKAARSGDALAFFPEGTFTNAPGLRPFKPGAFRAAWQGRLQLVPIAIFGARNKLPAQVWLPGPGALAIRICRPIDPAEHNSAAAMMAAVRRTLLAELDEPDLGAAGAPVVSARSAPPDDDL